MENIDFIVWIFGFPIITTIWEILLYKSRKIQGKKPLTEKEKHKLAWVFFWMWLIGALLLYG